MDDQRNNGAPGSHEQSIRDSARRKIAGKSDQLLSALLREAVTDYWKRIAG